MAKHARNPEELDGYGKNANQDDIRFTQNTSGFDKIVFQTNDRSNPYVAPTNPYGSYPGNDYGATARQSAAPQNAYAAGRTAPVDSARAASYPAETPSYGTRGQANAAFGEQPADAYEGLWADEPDASKLRKKHRGLKRFLGVAAVLLIALIVVCGLYIHEFDSRLEANQSTPDEMADVLTPKTPGEPYYMLLLGSDWRENSGTSKKADQSGDNQRADVIVLTRVDEANNQVTLVTVPRDTRWEHDGTVSKINEAYNIGGAALMTKAVSELTGVPISNTAEIHFSGLMNMVDALGGVEVDVPQSIYFWDALTGEGIEVEAGHQRLNGQEAQVFARVRHDYAEQEGQRQSNVRTLLMAIANEIRSKSPLEWPFVCLDLANCFGSDMRFFDFAGLMLGFTDSGITMYSATGPNKGDIDAGTGLWLCYPNPEGWQRLMEVVDAGDDPSSVDVNAGFENQGSVNTELLEGESVYSEEAEDVQWDQVVAYDDWAVEPVTQPVTEWEYAAPEYNAEEVPPAEPAEGPEVPETEEVYADDVIFEEAEAPSEALAPEAASETPEGQ